jgi:hypothetical protein
MAKPASLLVPVESTPEQPEAKPVSLATKLAEIMAEVEHVAKRGHNDHFGYDFATEADVSAAIRGGLAKRHVAILPSITDIQDQVVVRKTSNGEKTTVVTTVRMVFTFVDGETGEREDRSWAGRGEDSLDKGLAKAVTGGNKTFCLKTFQIPTGDDPERDSDRTRGKQQRRSRESTTRDERVDTTTGEVTSGNTNGTGGACISATQQRELIKAGQASGWKGADFAKWLKDQSYGEWSKIPASDYASVLSVMQGGTEAAS